MQTKTTYQYDDELGRFMCIDPLRYEQLSWSAYHYCGNDPINGKDPGGMWTTGIHEDIMREAIGIVEKNLNITFSHNSIGALVYGMLYVDKDQKNQFLHCMITSKEEKQKGKEQAINDAKANKDKFIGRATEIFNLIANFEQLGEALHPIADENAPSHNWKTWFSGGVWNPSNWHTSLVI